MRPKLPAFSSPLLRAVLAATMLGGCVYYNGMYNANRLANSARKAEREGRTFEANNLWGQVATKAESVVVRHPNSKYAEEAAILRGLALARLGQCEQALAPLGRLAVANVSTDLREDVWLATGRCHLTLGNMPAADVAFAQVVDSRNPHRRHEARVQRARTLRHAGKYEEVLAALEGMKDRRALAELLLALAGAGRVPEAMFLADSLIAQGDTTLPWDTLVVTVAHQDPSSASILVDRIRRLSGRTAESQARWLLEDGIRLFQVDTARAAARFREAVKVGGSGSVAGRASLQLVRLDLRAVSHPQQLSPLIQTMRNLAKNQSVAAELTQLSTTSAEILSTSASLMPGSPQGDLRLFLAAEAARDSLLAPRLAEGMFLRILNGWPESPYAPKAILAAQQLNPTWADTARALLESRYVDSPYLAMVRGEEASAYRQLEDSLGAFAAASSAPARGARPAAPGRAAPPALDDDEQPGRQRPRPAPGVRVPER
jgi:tetratricopeptide (TPR) repeat protein